MAVNKVVQSNGTTLIDITPTTAVASDVANGKIFFLADGTQATGTSEGGAEYTWETKTDQGITIVSDNPNYFYWTYTEALGADETYRITWGTGGTEYICQTQKENAGVSQDGYVIGNLNLGNASAEDTGEPFLIYKRTATQIVGITKQSAGSWHIKVEKQVPVTATLVTKAITANGTYNASDDSADGYSSVTVNVPSGGGTAMNTQTEQSTTRRNNTALGSITSLTCETAGTYDVYWTCARSNTSQTWGSQLYINGTAYGTENTTWNNNVQVNHLEDVVIPANATVAVYGRSRSGYYIYAPQLTIEQTA